MHADTLAVRCARIPEPVHGLVVVAATPAPGPLTTSEAIRLSSLVDRCRDTVGLLGASQAPETVASRRALFRVVDAPTATNWEAAARVVVALRPDGRPVSLWTALVESVDYPVLHHVPGTPWRSVPTRGQLLDTIIVCALRDENLDAQH